MLSLEQVVGLAEVEEETDLVVAMMVDVVETEHQSWRQAVKRRRRRMKRTLVGTPGTTLAVT